MARHVEILLIGEDRSAWASWRELPENWTLDRLEDLSATAWIPLRGGGLCKASAIAEAREIPDDKPEQLPDEEMRERRVPEALAYDQPPEPPSPSEYNT